jgi:hypothetical protein
MLQKRMEENKNPLLNKLGDYDIGKAMCSSKET